MILMYQIYIIQIYSMLDYCGGLEPYIKVYATRCNMGLSLIKNISLFDLLKYILGHIYHLRPYNSMSNNDDELLGILLEMFN